VKAKLLLRDCSYERDTALESKIGGNQKAGRKSKTHVMGHYPKEKNREDNRSD